LCLRVCSVSVCGGVKLLKGLCPPGLDGVDMKEDVQDTVNAGGRLGVRIPLPHGGKVM
jgi:hypothetical protein